MVLITGGAYQGKTEYAIRKFGFSETEIADGSVCNKEDMLKAKCITNYHIFVKRMLEENADIIAFTKLLCIENDKAVVIMNEIGCGIVPLEKKDRVWREMVGKCGCIIAENADTVIRISNSVPVAIKGRIQGNL